MHLATQIFLSVALILLVLGVTLALLRLPKDEDGRLAPRTSRERVRSLAGLLAVLVSDAAIVIVVIWGAGKLGGLKEPEAIGLVTGAFTAVSTMTVAYLGIKAVSNTAQVLTQGCGDEAPGGVVSDDAKQPSASPQGKPSRAEGAPSVGEGRKGVRRTTTRTSWKHRG